jgi:hypothetical protein
MPNEQLVSYIRENSSKFPKQTLTQALMAQGWAVGDIAAAFSKVEREAAGVPVAPETGPTQDAAFLAEMEKRRQQGNGVIPPTIVEGNTEIRPFASASRYLDRESDARGEQKGIIGLLIKWKVVKDVKQANIAMIGFVIVTIIIIAWLNWPASAPTTITPHMPVTPSVGTPSGAVSPTQNAPGPGPVTPPQT